jgi:heme/copper-type cytochrome/quinol oxidase subunit 4
LPGPKGCGARREEIGFCGFSREADMSSFQTYLVGFIILIIGLALAAHLLGAPPLWIAVGVIVMIGVGIIAATDHT